MATDYIVESKQLYQDLLNDGFTLIVRTQGSVGTWNDETLAYDNPVQPVDITTYGILKQYNSREIDGNMIQLNDQKLIISAFGLPELTTNHQILINNVVQNVINIKKFAPALTTFGYEIQLRGM